MIVSSWNDVLNAAVESAMWLQPVIWMMVFYVKSTRFDSVLRAMVIAALPVTVALHLMPINWPYQYAFIPLFTLYGSLALAFTLILMKLGWHGPQALSAGFLTAFVGSYFWEVPIIVKNAFITGPTGDWFLHALGLFYVYFMVDTVGWVVTWRNVSLILIGLAISTIFMLNWSVAPVTSITGANPGVWNSGYWMLNRLIGALITFTVIRKTPPRVMQHA